MNLQLVHQCPLPPSMTRLQQPGPTKNASRPDDRSAQPPTRFSEEPYELSGVTLTQIDETLFAAAHVLERTHLQAAIRSNNCARPARSARESSER